MKRTILTVFAVAGVTACAFGQSVVLDNIGNSSLSPTSPTNGLLFYYGPGGTPTLFDGVHYDLGVTVWGGPTQFTMTLMGIFTPPTDPKGYTGYGLGQFQLFLPGVALAVPGVAPGATAWIQLDIWAYNGPLTDGGTYSSYPAAIGHASTWSIQFQNPTSNPGAGIPAPDLIGMPGSLEFIPEPSSSSLLILCAGFILPRWRRGRNLTVTPFLGARLCRRPAAATCVQA